MWYYLNGIIEVDEDINVDRILLDKKSNKNVLVYNILYKKFMDARPAFSLYFPAFGLNTERYRVSLSI